MSWLLWREYRLNRLLAYVGLGLMLIPYIMMTCAVIYRLARGWDVPNLVEALGYLALYSIALSQVAVVFMGGNAIAGERLDRSAEFVAVLPISRLHRIVSKLLISSIATAITWLPNLLLLLMVSAVGSFNQREVAAAITMITFTAITAFTAYAVAWMVSSFQTSPTFSVVAGLMTPFLVFTSIQLFSILVLEIKDPYPAIGVAYSVICGVIAVTSFSVGTWHFLQRIEP